MPVGMKLVAVGALAVASVVAGCSTRNYAVCCTSDVDCGSIGSMEPLPCAGIEVCSNHQCVAPTCTVDADCPAEAPICSEKTCVPCDADHPCDAPQVCKTDATSCVGCNADADCGGTTPVCDANACRACTLDSECPSEACADDGSCVPEAGVAYIDLGGADTGTCDHAHPCASPNFALGTMSNTRSHLVMHTGDYPFGATVSTTTTTASMVTIHGNDSILEQAVSVASGLVARRLSLVGIRPQSLLVGATANAVFEQVTIGNVNMQSGVLTLRDAHISRGINACAGSNLVIDRVVSQGSIIGNPGCGNGSGYLQLDVTNLLLFGATIPSDLSIARGAMRFSTIVDSGSTSGNAYGVECNPLFSIQSSIIWTPGSSAAHPPVDGCPIASSIVGPTAVTGAMNVDPQFVNAAAHDYHLKASSPAKDAVTSGPTLDFEGDPRPQGAKFDLGADEVRQ